MELNELLDDIQGDLQKAENSLNLPDSETAPEQTTQNVNIPSTSQDNSPHADDIKALEHFKTCLVYRNALESMELVPKSLAQEIFTMLPDLGDAMLAAKLTNAASAHNKSLLLNRLDDYQKSPESLMPMFSQIYTTLGDVQTKLAEVLPTVVQVMAEVEAQIQRTSTTAMVVFCRKTYNLYEDPISVLITIDDRLIDFQPYEGKLVQSLMDIMYTSCYSELAEGRSAEVTFMDVIRTLRGMHMSANNLNELLDSTRTKLCQYDPKMFTQVDFNRMVEHINSANRIINYFTKETQMLDAVLKFLRLLV